jgi:hypothetical protein
LNESVSIYLIILKGALINPEKLERIASTGSSREAVQAGIKPDINPINLKQPSPSKMFWNDKTSVKLVKFVTITLKASTIINQQYLP